MIQPMYGDCCTVAPESNEEESSPLEITALSASIGASIVNGVLLERGSPSTVGGSVGVLGGTTSLTIGLSGDAKYPTASSLAGATSVVLGSWTLLSAFGAVGTEKALGTSINRSDQTQNLSVEPTTITTVDGSTQPGVQAILQF